MQEYVGVAARIQVSARTSEVIHAKWSEIDLDQRSWTIPQERMKARVEHRVPLSNRSVEILERAKEITDGSDYLFPGRFIGKPISNMAFLMIIRRMQANATAHGFRSSFKDWATERTNFAMEVSEMALAHTVTDKVEAAYRRGDLFEKRRKLMATWALNKS